MKSDQLARDTDKHHQEAAHWMTRLLSGEITPTEQRAYQAWLKKDVHNKRALNEMRNLWIDLRKPLESGTYEIPFPPGFQSWHQTFSNHGKKYFMAISFLLLITLIISQWMNVWRYNYVTNTGEQKTLLLQDGTRMWLNTNTALDLTFNGDKKQIKIIRGEVFFESPSQQSPPLTIEVGHIIIRAFNSALNVFQKNDDTFISVDRGQAIVVNKKGEEIPINNKGLFRADKYLSGSDPATSENINFSSSWKNGKIIFVNQNLYSVLETVKRYEKRWIIYDISSAKQLNLSSVVDIWHLDAWYQQLGSALNLDVQIIGPVVWIREIPQR
ncbi:FecR domain-containing protein (plasmid) [Pantoea agglomerans]|jgi:transmembrane sensor|uniref:FecR family protein n=1 Tax=Enterobacter agglomerans TaxID=549 RepID=UPI002D7A297F|nr:FecR domain-containing protein [Pantoea agglomerans]WRO92092.1 FecR domain-containing protein [Pantoea agglomerans]